MLTSYLVRLDLGKAGIRQAKWVTNLSKLLVSIYVLFTFVICMYVGNN